MATYPRADYCQCGRSLARAAVILARVHGPQQPGRARKACLGADRGLPGGRIWGPDLEARTERGTGRRGHRGYVDPRDVHAGREREAYDGRDRVTRSLFVVGVFVLVFVLILVFFVLVAFFVEVLREVVFRDVLFGIVVGFRLLVVIPVIIFLDVTFVVFVGSEDPVPVGNFNGVVADQAHAVVVSEVLELVELAVDLAALTASDDLAHGYRVRCMGRCPERRRCIPARTTKAMPRTGIILQSQGSAIENCSGTPLAAEKKPVSKSLIAIGALGVAASLVLSLLMQDLLKVKQERDRSPLELELEAPLEGRLIAPLRVIDERPAGTPRVRVRLSVLAGLRKERIAEAVGAQAWHSLQGAGNEPTEVVVEVADEDRGPVTRLVVPRPARRR